MPMLKWRTPMFGIGMATRIASRCSNHKCSRPNKCGPQKTFGSAKAHHIDTSR